MIKTITIDDKDIVLDNNVGWTLIYRDQFGRDIIPAIMPLLAGALDVVSGIFQEAGDKKEITIENLAKLADGDTLINAMIHIGGFEFVDFINITWALAKNADDSIPEPNIWLKQFDEFPIDVIGPEVVKLIFKGMVSSKNLERLNGLMKNVQPKKRKKSTSTR
jgi:hypothetical protein